MDSNWGEGCHETHDWVWLYQAGSSIVASWKMIFHVVVLPINIYNIVTLYT